MHAFKQVTGTATQHTEEQKQQIYSNLPADEKRKQSYSEWVKEAYNDQYEKWMPWIEDQYLKWFGNGDNKASYATKDALGKSKVTSVRQVDQLQDDANNLIGNQVGENGIAAPLGNLISKEGINRMERNGKDERGSYAGAISQYTDPMIKGVSGVGKSISGGAESANNYLGRSSKD